jgi:hypothetical protein
MSGPASEVMRVQFRTVNGVTVRYAESGGNHDNSILLTSPFSVSSSGSRKDMSSYRFQRGKYTDENLPRQVEMH